MADVARQITLIKQAVYGKEVRGAFCDAIDAMNHEVTDVVQSENVRKEAEGARVQKDKARDELDKKLEQEIKEAERTKDKLLSDEDARKARFLELEKSAKALIDEIEASVREAKLVLVDKTLTKKGQAADAYETGQALRAVLDDYIECKDRLDRALPTDKTLTEPGKAADAQAVGKRFEALTREANSRTLSFTTHSLDFEQRWVCPQDGFLWVKSRSDFDVSGRYELYEKTNPDAEAGFHLPLPPILRVALSDVDDCHSALIPVRKDHSYEFVRYGHISIDAEFYCF